ncbi:MAG TPA: hypothetical protein VMC09_11495 [Anaerolineales bacterium]|nr:hypothetical protein [Anaerolineales bacterium]
MTTVTKVVQESAAFQHFRVPQFQVKAQGAPFSPDGRGGSVMTNFVRDVTQLTYKDSLKEIDGFDLTVNNWNATTRALKYVGSETQQSLNGSGAQSTLYHLFDPNAKVFEIHMGYLDNLRMMMKGNCTGFEPKFPNSGASTMVVHGLNVLHKLRTKQYSENKFDDKRPSKVAQAISQKTDPEKHCRRFPIPIEINQAALSKEKALEAITETNQYDIDFLFTLARRVGYIVYVFTDDSGQDRLYFGPSQGDAPQPLRKVTYELKWGVSLMDFNPSMNAANQVWSVTVRSYNRSTRSTISETVDLNDSSITINRDLIPLLSGSLQAGACGDRQEVVVNEPVRNSAEARQRALAILTERFKQFVTAQGSTIGLPDLRAGMQLNIQGLGSRFSGLYFVTDTAHTIGESGYTTRFTARREDPGS